MKGDIIPDRDHVSRYAKKTTIVNDRITGAAFSLRPELGEKYLSVNWLEYFVKGDLEKAVKSVRQTFIDKKFTLTAGARFVVLNVLKVREHVKKETPDNINLSILHEPSFSDPSHSGIFGIPKNDMLVEELIAETINEGDIFPARL